MSESSVKSPQPNLIVAGTMKSGTSSLHDMLSSHPEIFMTRKKELHYWDTEDLPSIDEYEAHFFEGRDFLVRGETTPSYIYHPKAVERIYAYRPSIKIIVILRDPVKRAASHLRHIARRREKDNRPFDPVAEIKMAIKLERERGRGAFIGGARSYLGRGDYAFQLHRLFDHFPRGQVHILKLEDVLSDPNGSSYGLCDFLCVKKRFLTFPHMNKSRSSVELPYECVDMLTDYYAPILRELSEYYNIKF